MFSQYSDSKPGNDPTTSSSNVSYQNHGVIEDVDSECAPEKIERLRKWDWNKGSGFNCKVCGDGAIGKNYGVQTCDGCKSFFRRNQTKANTLKCTREKKCDFKSKRCLFCRLQKCFQVGMRSFKNPNATFPSDHEEYYSLDNNEPSSSSQDTSSGNFTYEPSELQTVKTEDGLVESSEEENSIKKIQAIIKRFHENWSYSENYFEKLIQKKFKTKYIKESTAARVNAWKLHSVEIETELKSLMSFIALLEDDLSADDKYELFKRYAFPMYLIRISRGLTSDGLMLSDGRVISPSQLSMLYGDKLARMMTQFAESLVSTTCSDSDIAMFTAFIFYQPFIRDQAVTYQIDNPDGFDKARCDFKKLFYQHTLVGEEDEQVYFDMFDLMPKLGRLNKMYHEMIGFLKPYENRFSAQVLFKEFSGIVSLRSGV